MTEIALNEQLSGYAAAPVMYRATKMEAGGAKRPEQQQGTALDAFLARKAEIEAMLARLWMVIRTPTASHQSPLLNCGASSLR
jgi:hypothetical protein